MAAIFAFAPKQSRVLWQVLGTLAVLAVLVIIVIARTSQLQSAVSTLTG